MNLWIFSQYACSPSTGPHLRHYAFAKKLSEMGYKVSIFASNRIHFNDIVIDTGDSNYVDHLEDGINFIRIKTPSYSGNSIERFLNWTSYYRQLFSVTKKIASSSGTPDIILGSSPQPLACVAAIQVAKRYKVPAISEVRDLWPEAIFSAGYAREDSLLGKVLLKGENWIYKKSNSIIFTIEGGKDYFVERSWDLASGGNIDMDKIYYINNGVDLESFHKNMMENPYHDPDLEDERKFNIIYAGTIREMNNLDLVLDAAKIILESDKDVQFLIFGDGSHRQELERRIETEGISNVKIKGFVDKKYIASILSKGQATILNYSQAKYNWSRGTSNNKLFEYMASGKAIISTIKTGYSIIDKYDCGISLEEQSPANLAKAVHTLREMSPERRVEIAENARRGASDFDFGELSRKLSICIDETLERFEEIKR